MTADGGRAFKAGTGSQHPTPSTAPQQEDFDRALREVEYAARDWGVKPDMPEGRFVTALMMAIGLTGRVSEAARDEFRRLFDENRRAAEVELKRAQELTKVVATSIKRAQAAEVGLICEREAVTQKMVNETLPVVAERLKALLVIRERAWNRRVAARLYAFAAAVALALFTGGYVLRDLGERTPSQEVDRCLTHPIRAGERTYCDLDVMLGTGR